MSATTNTSYGSSSGSVVFFASTTPVALDDTTTVVPPATQVASSSHSTPVASSATAVDVSEPYQKHLLHCPRKALYSEAQDQYPKAELERIFAPLGVKGLEGENEQLSLDAIVGNLRAATAPVKVDQSFIDLALNERTLLSRLIQRHFPAEGAPRKEQLHVLLNECILISGLVQQFGYNLTYAVCELYLREHPAELDDIDIVALYVGCVANLTEDALDALAGSLSWDGTVSDLLRDIREEVGDAVYRKNLEQAKLSRSYVGQLLGDFGFIDACRDVERYQAGDWADSPSLQLRQAFAEMAPVEYLTRDIAYGAFWSYGHLSYTPRGFVEGCLIPMPGTATPKALYQLVAEDGIFCLGAIDAFHNPESDELEVWDVVWRGTKDVMAWYQNFRYPWAPGAKGLRENESTLWGKMALLCDTVLRGRKGVLRISGHSQGGSLTQVFLAEVLIWLAKAALVDRPDVLAVESHSFNYPGATDEDNDLFWSAIELLPDMPVGLHYWRMRGDTVQKLGTITTGTPKLGQDLPKNMEITMATFGVPYGGPDGDLTSAVQAQQEGTCAAVGTYASDTAIRHHGRHMFSVNDDKYPHLANKVVLEQMYASDGSRFKAVAAQYPDQVVDVEKMIGKLGGGSWRCTIQ